MSLPMIGGGPADPVRRDLQRRLAGLVISGISIVILFGTVDVGATLEILRHAQLWFIAVAVVALAAQVLVRGWRWSILLPDRPDGRKVPMARTIAPMLIGYLGNALLPARLGEPIRAFLIARREGLVPLESFGATMLERLIDVVVLAVMALAAAAYLDARWWVVAVGLVGSVAGLAAIVLLVLLGFGRLVGVLGAVLRRLGLADRLGRLLAWGLSFAAGVDRGRDVPRLLAAMTASVLAWALDASIFYFVGHSLGIDLGFADAILIGAVGVLATAIPAAPASVGTFELAATATAVALGVPRGEALALAVLVHVVTVVPIALAGAVALVASGARLSTVAEEAVDAESPGAGKL